MDIRKINTKFKPVNTGVVTALDTNNSGQLLISVNHFVPKSPTLVVQDIDGESMMPIEFTEDFNNSITAALFASDRFVLYKKMNLEGFDYCKYDILEQEKVVLRSTLNPAIGVLSVYQNKMIIADSTLFVLDWQKNFIESELLMPQEFSLEDVIDKGYLTMFDEENYGVSGIKDNLVFVVNCRTGRMNQSLRGSFKALNPMFASSTYFMGISNTQEGVFLWSKANSAIIQSAHFSEKLSGVSCFAISDDNRLFGFGDLFGRVMVIELDSDRIILNKKIHAGRVTAVCLDSESPRLFSGGDKGDVFMVQL
jgi:hypothetical protein